MRNCKVKFIAMKMLWEITDKNFRDKDVEQSVS